MIEDITCATIRDFEVRCWKGG